MLHLFVNQYLFLQCITKFLHWNYHWVFLWFCRLYSDGLELGSDLWLPAVVLWNSASHVSTMLRSNLDLPIIRSLIFYRVIETIKWMRSPHTSYRWRAERVIEPIKCMHSPHTSYRWRAERVIEPISCEWSLGVDRLSAQILSILPIIDIGHFQNRFADIFFFYNANKHTIYRWHYLLVNK